MLKDLKTSVNNTIDINASDRVKCLVLHSNSASKRNYIIEKANTKMNFFKKLII